MSPDGPPPRVLALLCRACRHELPTATHDVVFRCPRCGRAWELEGADLSARGSYHVTPPGQPGGGLLYLPYWSFPSSARATPIETEASTLTARDLAGRIDRIYVAAYAVHRPGYLGEWGLAYTRQRPDWEVRQGPGPALPGGSITSSDAREIARQYVLSEIDRRADLSRLQVEVQVGEAELWAIPCLDLGARLRCPWTRSELPSAALDDLSEIRTAIQRLEA